MSVGMVCAVSWWAYALAGTPAGVALVESGTVAPDLQRYLRDRIGETFGEGDEPGQFRVVLDGVNGELSVTEGEHRLATRALPTQPEDAPTAWIFVRSTLERALTPSDPTPAIPEPGSQPKAAPTAIVPIRPLRPAPMAVESLAPPRRPAFGRYAVHGLVGAQLSDTTPSLGLRIGADRTLGSNLRIGAEVGYRYGSPTAAFERHGVPLQLRAGYLPAAWPVELGVMTGAELVLAETSRTSAFAVDVEAGAFGRVATDLYGSDRGALAGVVEAAAAVALRRSSYTVPAGQLEDGLFRLRLQAGVEWRWL